MIPFLVDVLFFSKRRTALIEWQYCTVLWMAVRDVSFSFCFPASKDLSWTRFAQLSHCSTFFFLVYLNEFGRILKRRLLISRYIEQSSWFERAWKAWILISFQDDDRQTLVDRCFILLAFMKAINERCYDPARMSFLWDMNRVSSASIWSIVLEFDVEAIQQSTVESWELRLATLSDPICRRSFIAILSSLNSPPCARLVSLKVNLSDNQ